MSDRKRNMNPHCWLKTVNVHKKVLKFIIVMIIVFCKKAFNIKQYLTKKLFDNIKK